MSSAWMSILLGTSGMATLYTLRTLIEISPGRSDRRGAVRGFFQALGDDERSQSSASGGDQEGGAGTQGAPAVAGIQRAQRAAHAGDGGIIGLAASQVTNSEAALHEMHGGGMETAEAGCVQQLRQQQHEQVVGQIAPQQPAKRGQQHAEHLYAAQGEAVEN